MTERERAEQLRDEVISCFHVDADGEKGVDFDKIYDLITQALEQTRREAFEEAAKVAEQFKYELSTDATKDESGLVYFNKTMDYIAKAIRAQAQRQGPSDQRGDFSVPTETVERSEEEGR